MAVEDTTSFPNFLHLFPEESYPQVRGKLTAFSARYGNDVWLSLTDQDRFSFVLRSTLGNYGPIARTGGDCFMNKSE